MPTHSDLLDAIATLRAALSGLAGQVEEAHKARDAYHTEMSDRMLALEKVVRDQAAEIGSLKGAIAVFHPSDTPEPAYIVILRMFFGLLEKQPIIPLLLFLLVIIIGAGELSSLYRHQP